MKNLFESMTEAVAYVQILASPLLVGLVISSIIYFPNPGLTRFIIGIFIIAAALVVGIFLANKAWKGKGTVRTISRLNASPELDDLRCRKNQIK